METIKLEDLDLTEEEMRKLRDGARRFLPVLEDEDEELTETDAEDTI